jgi:hypothetical protein
MCVVMGCNRCVVDVCVCGRDISIYCRGAYIVITYTFNLLSYILPATHILTVTRVGVILYYTIYICITYLHHKVYNMLLT